MKKDNFQTKHFREAFTSRSFRVGGYSVLAVVFVLAIAIVLNLLANALPASITKLDTTSNQLFSISEQTETLVGGLDRDITIYLVAQSGTEDDTVQNLLTRYQDLSNRIILETVDPDVYPTFVQQYASRVTNNSLIVTCGDRYRYVDSSEIYVIDYYAYYTTGTQDVSFNGESALTSAIDYVISENLPKLYLLSGHGELALPATFSSAVRSENIETAELSLLTDKAVPEDADCVLIYAPQSDISTEEVSLLQDYLARGGNLTLIADPPKEEGLPNLHGLLAGYGASPVEGIVVEGAQDHYTWDTPYYLLPDIHSHSITAPLLSADYHVLLPLANGIAVSDNLPEGVSVTTLLSTSDNAFSKIAGYNLTNYEKEEGDIAGPFALAVAITGTIDEDTQSNIIWVASGSLLDEQTNAQVSGGNQDLFLNIINFLCEPESSSLTIHAKALQTEYLTMEASTATLLTVLVVILIPLAYLAIGIVLWVRRKRR